MENGIRVIESVHPNSDVDTLAVILVCGENEPLRALPMVFDGADSAERFLQFSEVDPVTAIPDLLWSEYGRRGEIENQGFVKI